MATLVDGLGFEELGDAGDPGSKVATLFLTGSITTQSDVNVAGTISGAGNSFATDVVGTTSVSGLNVLAQASGTFGRVVDVSGAMFSISTGSSTLAPHGVRIQVGSTETTAEGFGSCIFESHFANQGYFWAATLGSSADTLTTLAGSGLAVVSGTTPLNISGFIIKGAPASPYTWVAIGL